MDPSGQRRPHPCAQQTRGHRKHRSSSHIPGWGQPQGGQTETKHDDGTDDVDDDADDEDDDDDGDSDRSGDDDGDWSC